MSKKIKLMGVTIAMLAVCICGSAFAWLSDHEEDNAGTFTIGKVDIALTGVDTDGEVVPNEDFGVNPVITLATGSEAAYVFAEVNIPRATAGTIATGSGSNMTIKDAEYEPIADFVVDDDWVEIDSVGEEDDDSVKKIYAYTEVLQDGESTPAVFSSAKVQNFVYEESSTASGDVPTFTDVPCKVRAYAIQSDGVDEPSTNTEYKAIFYDAYWQEIKVDNYTGAKNNKQE